ncbi:lysozyme family protein [Insolitispirillum peregrinum]|uniref:hypothetical protein n=1 Tax=Insolitispirillum peregrinum TaxID=80876 RepID=UPI00111582B5|nr:hypothetical protein [Insolitispirillum peregrinum]
MGSEKSTENTQKEAGRKFVAPPPIPLEEYNRVATEHLNTFEGYVPRIYSDTEGIPTMGAGTALFSKNKDKKFSLRSLDEIGKEINLDHPYQFSEK